MESKGVCVIRFGFGFGFGVSVGEFDAFFLPTYLLHISILLFLALCDCLRGAIGVEVD